MTAVNAGRESGPSYAPPLGSSTAAPGEPTTARASHLAILTTYALFAALVQVAILAYVRFVGGHFIYMGWNVVWLGPLANLLLFGLVGLPFAVVGRWVPRLSSAATFTVVYAFLAFFSILMVQPGLHIIAIIVLSLGAAAQLARMAAKRPVGYARVIRVASMTLLAVTVALGATVAGLGKVRERRALAALPAARAGSPNVLLLILDTVRSASLSLYGYERPTSPVLASWAPRGVLFEQATSTAPWTLPSHAGIFTGRWAHETSVGWNRPLDGTFPTLAEALRDRGYTTGGFVANLAYTTGERGLDRGFIRYEDFSPSLGQLALSAPIGRWVATRESLRQLINNHQPLNRKPAAMVNGEFLDWLGGRGNRPFFAFLNYFDAHVPYMPPEPFDEQFGRGRAYKKFLQDPNTPVWNQAEKMSEGQKRRERDAYDGSIASLDREIGRLLDELKRRGVLDNTIVIVAADHGEEFREHGAFGHGFSLYMPVMHVPLWIMAPGKAPAGARVSESVSLRDIPATVLDLTGNGDAAAKFPGRSLARYWAPVAADSSDLLISSLRVGLRIPRASPAAKGNMASVIRGRYHYIRNGDGSEEVYDVVADPWEFHNLADSAAGRDMRARYHAALPDMSKKLPKW